MKSFKEFRNSVTLQENLIRKGAVTAFALRGKRNGDKAVYHFMIAKRTLSNAKAHRTADEAIRNLEQSLNSLYDGLIELRNQIGSISAQITSGSIA